MTEPRRRAYLEAMGFDVWIAKPAPATAAPVFVGPGQHSTLLVCESAAASATPIAGDVARAIGGQPVWGWPEDGGEDGVTDLQQAISDRLFTRVIVFGPLAESCLPQGSGRVIGSASVAVTSSLGELAERGDARRAFWQLLRGDRNGDARMGVA